MSGPVLEDLFNPPKLNIGQLVRKKDAGLFERRRGRIVSVGGWFAVVQWDGIASHKREYIPDLEPDKY